MTETYDILQTINRDYARQEAAARAVTHEISKKDAQGLTQAHSSVVSANQGTSSTAAPLVVAPANNNPFNQGLGAVELAYLMIFESVKLSHDSAQIQAKSVEANAAKQNSMINLEAKMNFYTLRHSQLFTKKWGRVEYSKIDKTFLEKDMHDHWDWWNYFPRTYKWTNKKVGQTALNDMQSQNQQVSASRNIMEDKLNVLKQNASISETNLNTASNESQQAISQGSSLMQMLTSLTNQISRI